VLAEGDEIGVNEFPQIAAQSGSNETPLVPEAPESLPGGTRPAPLVLETEPNGALQAGAHTALPPQNRLSLLDAAGDVLSLEAIESAAIRFAIYHYRGQMSEVARKLRIGRSTLYRKLDNLGLAGAGMGSHKTDVAGR